jgi:hypothetical protein
MVTTDMVSGRATSGIRHYPEKVNRYGGQAIEGQARSVEHYANFVECVRSRKEPNSAVEIGYRSAIAAHMAICLIAGKRK